MSAKQVSTHHMSDQWLIQCSATAQVKHVIEEEWSYIPVGGPLPLGDQPVTAFGAAANLVHPATGYSIARSLREAPALAAEMAVILRKDLPVQETSRQVWNALWPAEKRRQVCELTFVSIHVPGTIKLDSQCMHGERGNLFRIKLALTMACYNYLPIGASTHAVITDADSTHKPSYSWLSLLLCEVPLGGPLVSTLRLRG